MSSFSVAGSDTIQIATRTLVNLAEGDVAKVSYPNDLITLKTGKDGNSIFAVNSNGQQVDVELRVLRGSNDDKFLSSLMSLQLGDLAAFPLMSGYIVKRIGDGSGNAMRDTYILSGGVFSKLVPVTSNVDGDTNQSVSVYSLKYALSSRALM